MNYVKLNPLLFAGCFFKKNEVSKKDIALFKSAIKNSINLGIMDTDKQNFYIIDRGNKIKCNIKQLIIDLDNDKHYSALLELVTNVMKYCHVAIQKIPDADGVIGGHFGLKDKSSTNEETIANSILYKMTNEQGKRSILYLISQIIFKINANHIYNNGNKRTSILTAALVLKNFGYDIIHRIYTHELVKEWETFMLKIANYKNVKELKNENNTIKFISNIIKKVIILG